MPDTHEEPKFQLSLVQVLAAALASITSAVILSYFGVAGTVIGTAVGSVVSTVGVAVYAHTMRRARSGVTSAARHRRDAALHQDRSPTPPVTRAGSSAAWNHRRLGSSAGMAQAATAVPWSPSNLSRLPWKALAVSAGGVFAVALAIIVVVQFAGGFSLTNLLHGKGTGSGPSVACVVGSDSCVTSPTPTPSPEERPTSGATTQPTAAPTQTVATPTPVSPASPTPFSTPSP